MSRSQPPASGGRRSKLGLALAGGGFRASLFHLGVLRRMAELDLLREVEVLSTVSGGSIIGALYILLLKRRLDKSAQLTRDDYLAVVADLQCVLVRAIQKNLRTRLVMNPLGILRVLLTHHTFGKRMARLYERHLYREAVDLLELRPERRYRPGWFPFGWFREPPFRPGFWPLRDLRFVPGGEKVSDGIEAYNARAAASNGARLPSLVLNATSLNSGRPFRFSSVEIGDPVLGSFRYDEIDNELLPRKILIENDARTSDETLLDRYSRELEMRTGQPLQPQDRESILAGVDLWRRRDDAASAWLNPIVTAELGLLRRAKIAAWYLQRGIALGVTGGVQREVHKQNFWLALGDINEAWATKGKVQAQTQPGFEDDLQKAVLQVYYARTAERMSSRLKQDWDLLSLADAVGASACFPPVFPPFIVHGIYDDLSVTRLGLTDGGVYDNVGITTLIEERCTHIIASDTGALFDPTERSSSGRLGMASRIVGILMDDVAALQRGVLREQRSVNRAVVGAVPPPVPQDQAQLLAQLQQRYDLEGLAFFHIGSPPLGVGGGAGDAEAAARLRTDLDAFGDVEVAALFDAGYRRADEYIRAYIRPGEPAGILPILPVGGDRAERILAAGRSRTFRALMLGAPLSWSFSVVLLAVLAFLAGRVRLPSVTAAATSLGSEVLALENGLLVGLPALLFGVFLRHPPLLGAAVIVLGVAGLVLAATVPQRVLRARQERRGLLTAVKWARGLAGNVLWLMGLSPIWLALLCAVAGWASHLFYALPFLAATRDRRVRLALSARPVRVPTDAILRASVRPLD